MVRMAKKKFTELPPVLRAVLVAVGAVQVGLLIAAQVDITRRPAEQIRGRKATWRLVGLLNTVGPLAYFKWGRKRFS